MRTTLILAAMVVGWVNLFAQGTVNFANDNARAVTNSLTGQPIIAGTIFKTALYYLPDQANAPQWADFDAAKVTLDPSVAFYSSGLFNGGVRTTPVATYPGGGAWFQVRTWESTFGTSYEQALAAPPMAGRRALVGTSNILRVGQTGNPGQTPPANLTTWGLQGFSLIPAFDPGLIDFANNANSAVTNSLTDYSVVAGTTFKAALYYLPDQVPPPTNEGQFTRQLGGSVGFASPGVYAGGTRATPNTPPGGFSHFIVKVWETAFGTSYETALANPNTVGGRRALVGTSNIIRAQSGENTPGALTSFGLQGFRLVSVPTNTGPRISGFSVDSVLTFLTETGHTYMVEKTASLNPINWNPLNGTNIVGTGGAVSVSDPGSGCLDQRYYRVRLVQ